MSSRLRLLANENVPRLAIEGLRSAGHDVVWIRESGRGSPDETVLARSLSEGRILLTLDKDFGDLVYRQGRAASCGVVLVRVGALPPSDLADLIVRVLASREDWRGQFSIIERDRIRMRTLPE